MSFWQSILPALAAGGAVYGGHQMASKLGQTGEDAAAQMGALAGQLQEDTAFKGYGVTTTLGTSSVNADGSTNLGVGQAQPWTDLSTQYRDQGLLAMDRANAMARDPAAREQEIYERNMAMQNPMLDSQQAAQQANEFAMGRGGVRGSQFGGTAEDAAMARARAQASNEAAFGAMQQTQSEMMNQAALSNQYNQQGMGAYQSSFMPMQQQMAMMGLAQGNAGMAQSGQFTGAGYASQLGLGGMQAQINAEKAATELYGNMFGSIMNNAGGIGEGMDNVLPWWLGGNG